MSASPESSQDPPHTPVLYQKVLELLNPAAGRRYVDATLGAGGHSFGVLERSAPDGQLLGLDRDPNALALAQARLQAFSERTVFRNASFADLDQQAAAIGWMNVDGILFDLGLSSMQLDDPERGFSFRNEGPLDMRFDPSQPTTAADLVNNLRVAELAGLISEFGEEPRALRIAKAIAAARPLHTTIELAQVVERALGGKRRKIHPATRTFQALRMAVNEETEALRSSLPLAVDLLAPGGRLVVIAFHSLEDRPVKHFFRKESMDCICPPERPVCTCEHRARVRILTRRPVRPDEAEMARNPRARSARLRAVERIVPEH